MFSERSNDGTRRSREQWFRRANRSEPEKGGARKSRVAVPQAWLEQTREAWAREANEALERAGCGERIDHRSLAELRDEAERSGDLERAAELSREPNVHLGPEAYRAGDLEQAAGIGDAPSWRPAGFWARRTQQRRTMRDASAGAGRPHRSDQGEIAAIYRDANQGDL